MARFKTNMKHVKADQSSFESGGGRGDTNWFKLKDGRQVLRVLPPWSEKGQFYMKVGYHRKPGKSMEKVVCPVYTFGEKDTCPICKARAKVYKSMGKDAGRPYQIQKRALLNVLDMKLADGKVYVLDAAASIVNPILNMIAEMDSDQIIDPNKGSNILITRKDDGGFTKYEVQIMPSQTDLEEKGYDVDDILDNLYQLDEFIKMPAPDDFTEILDALNEATYGESDTDSDDDDDDDDDETPAPKKKSKVVDDDDDDDEPAPPKKKSKPVVDDDDEDETPAPKKKKPAPVEDDEDDEVPAPKKKLKSQRVEEDEDEDETPAPKKKSKPTPVEDDEDEEEEEEPKPKSKLKKRQPEPEEDDLDGLTPDLDDVEGFDPDEEIPF